MTTSKPLVLVLCMGTGLFVHYCIYHKHWAENPRPLSTHDGFEKRTDTMGGNTRGLHNLSVVELNTDEAVGKENVSSRYAPHVHRMAGGGITWMAKHPKRLDSELTILSWPNKQSATCDGGGLVEIKGCKSLPNNKKCFLACDRHFYNKSEAIIFNLFYTNQFPHHRYEDQKWIFSDLEAPPQSLRGWPKGDILNTIKHQFNISSMFSSDSAVPNQALPKCVLRQDYNATKGPPYTFSVHRTHHAVWFVSHCNTQSQREDYVWELQKYISVDIFGRCGNNSCGSRGDRKPDCAQYMLNHKYRFYLSFENSLCENYVSEKVWKMIAHKDINIIPIFMGTVNYSAFMPPRTYIDVKDFESPEHLAEYLHEIANNETLFAEYLERKKSLSCERDESEGYMCRLCNYLHAHRGERDIIDDVIDFWSVERRCIAPHKYIPGIFWSNHSSHS